MEGDVARFLLGQLNLKPLVQKIPYLLWRAPADKNAVLPTADDWAGRCASDSAQ